MRLLYVCSDWGIPPDGTKGAAIHLRAITRALARLGHDVGLLSPKGVLGAGHPARPVLSKRCKVAEEAGRLLRDWLGDRHLPPGIGREVRPLLFNAWALKHVKRTLRDQPPDAIIERLSLFGHLGLDLAEAFDVPLILEVNAPLADEASTFRSLQLRELAAEIEERVLARADRIAVVSAPLADHLATAGVDREKMAVVPNGVDPEMFRSVEAAEVVRRRLGLNGHFVVGFAGSLKPWHGVDVLVDAFAELAREDAEARLLIVGTGPSEVDLHERVRAGNLADRVVFTGAVPHEQVPSYLRAMDVAVAPFLSSEGFYFSPIKLFEYMASATCVVASRLGQMAEVIEDGVDGVLCSPGDATALARCLHRLRTSASLRETLGRRAAEKVLSQYTWEHAARRVQALVTSEIERRRDGASAAPHAPVLR